MYSFDYNSKAALEERERKTEHDPQCSNDMASRHDPKLEHDTGSSSARGEMIASKSGKYQRQQQQQQQQYPPPQALPDYVNRALPPRPRTNSNASSIYDSPGEVSSPGPAKPMGGQQPPVVTEEDEEEEQHLSPTSAGVLDQAGLAMVQPLQPALTSTPSQADKEIVAPQPIYPAAKVLEVKNFVVSPVSAALPGNDGSNNGRDEVSPVSPDGSQRSLHSRISVSTSRPSSPTATQQNNSNSNNNTSSQLHRTPTNKSDRRRAVYKGYRTTQDPAAMAGSSSSPRSPHYQVHQINDRYSDPGSPISGAVIHPPTSFPSDPSLRSSRQLSEARQRQQSAASNNNDPLPHGTNNGIGNGNSNDNPETSSPIGGGAKLAPVASVSSNGSQRVAFAGLQRSDSGFAARPRAGSKRGAPPPLKLSERALVDNYVKTPFPDLGGGKGRGKDREKERGKEKEKEREGQPKSRFSHGGENSSMDFGMRWMGIGRDKDKEREKEKEKEKGVETPTSAKRRNRVSSLPGLGFLRSGPLSGNKIEKEGKEAKEETQAQAQAAVVPMPSEVRSGYVESTRAGTRPSRTPSVSKVKNILSKAKQIGLNRSLGMGSMLSSEEAKKERRRAEMKRQIRVEHARPA
ncbi:hypothetical protein F4821DRAFT_222821 [Hypoxylon rubiginosum]|uniref:Uncharacterized protein n=1 Tax=Hypoxylon rubiginosum TaxID=110542 RepID=A0ACC0DKN1_9PEZI|nr:hypothetical protein F4821DRAFT_222821 [Hypoxylon rubiginosum]